MRLVYLPAIWTSVLSERWALTPMNAFDHKLRGTEAYHPLALTSFGDPNWQDQGFAWEPDDFIFGDSGGYSAATHGRTFDPRDVIQWQIKFCRVGALLDQPPWVDWTARQDCLTRTVANLKAALPTYRRALDAGRPFRLWGVVHGRTRVELEDWWKAVSRTYRFTDQGEGWCFKPHPLNHPVAMADVLAFIKDKGITRAHFFATTASPSVQVLCAYGPGAGLEYASCDSGSPLIRGRNRALDVGCGTDEIKERFRDTKEQFPDNPERWDTRARDHMRHVCQCQSCEFLKEDVADNEGLMRDESYLYHRMMFHNLLDKLCVFERLHARYNSRVTQEGKSSETEESGLTGPGSTM